VSSLIVRSRESFARAWCHVVPTVPGAEVPACHVPGCRGASRLAAARGHQAPIAPAAPAAPPRGKIGPIMKNVLALTLAIAGAALQSPLAAQQAKASPPPVPYTQTFVRDPKIPIDEEYTRKIKEYTTEPFCTSPLVDYL